MEELPIDAKPAESQPVSSGMSSISPPVCLLEERNATLLTVIQVPRLLNDIAESTGIPRATVHRRLVKLVSKGLVERIGNAFRATISPQGAVGDPKESESPLNKVFPFLRAFPTPEHRAAIVLAIALAKARRDDLVDDRHGSIVFLGPTQKLKSLSCIAICHLLGADVAKCRIPAYQVRGRGMFVRLGPKGNHVYENDTLQELVIWVDELSRADANTTAEVMALIFGTKSVRIENENISIVGLPLIELNGKKKQGTLEERLGWDPAMIRRTFILDTSKVNVTFEMRKEYESILAKVKAVSPLHMPQLRKEPLGVRCDELIERAFESCIRPDMMDFTDWTRVRTAVLGCRAFLGDMEATIEVLRSYFYLASTTGFTHVDWPVRLSNAITAINTPKPKHAAPTPSTNETTGVANPMKPNPYDLVQNLTSLKQDLEIAGLNLAADRSRFERFVTAFKKFSASHKTDEAFFAFLEQIPTLDLLRANLAGIAPSTDVQATLKLVSEFSSRKIQNEEIDTLLKISVVAKKHGFSQESLKLLLIELGQSSSAVPIAEAFKALEPRSKEFQSFALEVQKLNQRKLQEQLEIESIQQKVSAKETCLAELDTQVSEKKCEAVELDVQISDLKKSRSDLFEFCSQQESCAAAWRKTVEVEKGHYAKLVDESRRVRASSLTTMILDQFVTNPKFSLNNDLSNALERLLIARRFDRRSDVVAARNEIAALISDSAALIKFPDDEVELRKTEILKLKADEEQLQQALAKSTEELLQIANAHDLAGIFAACLLQKETRPGAAAEIMKRFKALFDLLTQEDQSAAATQVPSLVTELRRMAADSLELHAIS